MWKWRTKNDDRVWNRILNQSTLPQTFTACELFCVLLFHSCIFMSCISSPPLWVTWCWFACKWDTETGSCNQATPLSRLQGRPTHPCSDLTAVIDHYVTALPILSRHCGARGNTKKTVSVCSELWKYFGEPFVTLCWKMGFRDHCSNTVVCSGVLECIWGREFTIKIVYATGYRNGNRRVTHP